MRTKALLLTAALSVAGVATSMAQAVYSVNAVGYVNVTVGPGFQMIANPLVAEDNTVAALLTGLPDGTLLYKFAAPSFAINTFISPAPGTGFWTDPGMVLNPGEGAFIFNPSASAITITFIGEVEQGNLDRTVPAGLSIQSSRVPQSGLLDADLEYPAQDGDIVYQFNATAQAYDIASAIDVGGSIIWAPSGAPTLAVGESVFVSKNQSATWARTFSVNE